MPSRVAAASALIVSARGKRRIESGDPEPLAKLAHPNGGPGVAVGGFAPHPVHRHGQLTIRQLAAELADRLYRARVAIGRIASGPHARDTQFGVTPAVPMDRDERLVSRLITEGILCAEQVVPGAPYQIRAADMQDERAAAAIGRTGRPCRIAPEKQLAMFPEA